MKKMLKRYWFFMATSVVMIAVLIFNTEFGLSALSVTAFSVKEMLLVIPPIFILLGLLDVWVPREIMVKYMGQGSGIRGMVLSIIAGSVAAGPLYGAFPIAAVFLKKGASLMNVFIFIGAWSTTKIPMFLFEYSALGPRFALTRLLVDIPGIVILALVLHALLSEKDRHEIIDRAEKIE
ncbi:MAG: permease [Spirochaetaceae bacterium]|nr:MAG: permease [Spirochaetaceae bacterium]